MDKEINVEQCPICGRGCGLSEVRCGRGRRFLEELNNGEITKEKIDILKQESKLHKKRHEEFKKLPQEERLMLMMSRCGNRINNSNSGHHGKGRILKVLAERGTITQSELQDIIDVRSGSLSEIISKIESMGFITKEKDENDRRKVNISITEKGKEVIELKKEDNKNSSKELFRAISEEEQNQLEFILSKLIKDWKRSSKHEDYRKDKILNSNNIK